LLSIITILLKNDLVNAKYLAEKHEVSVKTIQRDIETLNMAGIPVYSEKGMKGGYGILDSYKLETNLLSTSEVSILNSMLDGIKSIYSNKSLELLWEKLESAMDTVPNSERAEMKVDLSPWNQDEKVSEKINIISEAIRQKLILRLEYYNLHGQCSNREIEPYELVLRHGRWYLNAFCLQAEDKRVFKVNRISEIGVTDQHFTERDYEDYRNNEYRMQDNEKKILVFDKAAYPRIVDIFNADEIEEVTEENIRVTTFLKANSLLISAILSFGDQVKVIEPESLKNEVSNMIKKMNNIYN